MSLSLALAALLIASTSASDLRADGAFGFPQRTATVIADTPALRVSVVSDGTHLAVQAILWTDGDSALGTTDDGRKIGDTSSLILELDGDGAPTKDVDRTYALDPWPSLPGLRYSVALGGGASTGLQSDSKGRGAVRHVEHEGTKVRVDTYLIPLAEIGRTSADSIQIGFWASSPSPALIVDSVGHVAAEGQRYWPHQLSRAAFRSVGLASGVAAPIDPALIPEGRVAATVDASAPAKRERPKVGTKVGEVGGPPEIVAGAWMHWSDESIAAPSLAALKGKVVAVEFWATWCGPCVAGIPKLNDLHRKHASEGLVILSITDQERGAVQRFVEARGEGMTYPIGMESESFRAYGVTGIPQAFLIDREGTLVWQGHPGTPAFVEAIEKALAPR